MLATSSYLRNDCQQRQSEINCQRTEAQLQAKSWRDVEDNGTGRIAAGDR